MKTMKTMIAVMILSTFSASASVILSDKDFDVLERSTGQIKMEREEILVALSAAEARCILFKFGHVECLISNGSEEIVIRAEELKWTAKHARESRHGLNTGSDRTTIECRQNVVGASGLSCSFTSSVEDEWKEYCASGRWAYLFGELAEKTEHQQEVKVTSVDCEVDYGRTYDDEPLTNVTATVTVEGQLDSKVPIKSFSTYGQWRKRLSEAEACKSIHDFEKYVIKNGNRVPVVVDRELVLQEYVSIRNTNQIFIEEITLKFTGTRLSFRGAGNREVQGAYCAEGQ